MDFFELLRETKAGLSMRNNMPAWAKFFGQSFKNCEVTPYSACRVFQNQTSVRFFPNSQGFGTAAGDVREYYFGDVTVNYKCGTFVGAGDFDIKEYTNDIMNGSNQYVFIVNDPTAAVHSSFRIVDLKDRFFNYYRIDIAGGNTFQVGYSFVGVKITLQ